MTIRNIHFLLIIILSTVHLYGQDTVSGRIIDSYTQEPLAFANIVFNQNASMQTSTDIDGRFSYISTIPLNTLTSTHLGYEKQMVAIGKNKEMIVAMVGLVNPLMEVTVNPGVNPANRIIKLVIQNKSINNPEHIASFRYRSYNKTVYDFKSNIIHTADSAVLRSRLKGSHLFLMESVTERKFIKPDVSEEVVVATRVSGFKNPSFASLATDIQPFSFYQDQIKLLNIYYLNPISNGSLKKYKFHLEETLIKENDTVFVISFKQIPGKNFDALKGVLYVNSNKYAVQNVIAQPAEAAKISLKIQQQYQFIAGKYWFPEQLNYSLTANEYPTKSIGMLIDGKSYISNVEFNPLLKKKDFSAESVRIAEDASQKDSLYWNSNRKEMLTPVEQQTYIVLDSIGEKYNYDYYLNVVEKIADNKLPFHFVDIDLSKTFLANHYEGLRLGTGLYTNDKVFKNFKLGGFFGYGIKDERWKYGGEIQYTISKKNEFVLGISHQNNLLETGNAGLRLHDTRLFNFRMFMASRFDRIVQNSFTINRRSFKYLKWNLALNQTAVKPLYAYHFSDGSQDFTHYKNTDVSLFFRFAYGERRIQSFGNTFGSGTNYPVLYAYFSHGMKKVFGGNFNYKKIEMAVEQSFYTTNLGMTKYRIEAGYLNKPLPIGLLFTGEGSDDKRIPYIAKNTFQAMQPYEFLSDRYANLFLSHHFATLLFKSKHFQPDIILKYNIGWGALSNPLRHSDVTFKTREKVYLETGLQLDNILKFNFQNLGYLGMGGAVFCRHGAYAKPEAKDNLAYKFTMTFSIK